MSDPEIPEPYAQRILEAAVSQGRSAELLHALFDGGSVTITDSGELIIVLGSIFRQPDAQGDAR